MKLQHPFCINSALLQILDGVTSIDKYMANLRKYARTLRIELEEGEEGEEVNFDVRADEFKAIGDGFELFGEFFVRSFVHDDRLYLKNYRLMSITDNGIDAMAEDSRDGRPVFIQYKGYKNNEVVTGSHIDSFVAECFMVMMDAHESLKDYKFANHPRMIVITTAKEMARYTKQEKYRDRVEVFPHAALYQLTSSPTFWVAFRESVSR